MRSILSAAAGPQDSRNGTLIMQSILIPNKMFGSSSGVENSTSPLVIYECHGYKDEIKFQFTRPVGRVAMLQVHTYLPSYSGRNTTVKQD